MKKIPTMFVRDETKPGRPVIDQIKPECQWVLDGEGVATVKLDGTNVKVEGGKLFKRQKPKNGEYDEASYVEAKDFDPADKYIFEGFYLGSPVEDGLYEAVGPKIQGNPCKLDAHLLVKIDALGSPISVKIIENCPRYFNELREYLGKEAIEGLVFHHPDGRMAKIKRRDFGLPWPVKP